MLLSAVGFQLGRERLLDGGLLLEELEALPDPALELLGRLNLTSQLESVKQALEDRRSEAIKPGQALKGKLHAKHPAVLVPGLISCGLEVWQPGECFGDSYFRERIWGGVTMARAVVGNITCWLEHMSLDPHTSGDPPGMRLRAAEGFVGADYFIQGYWLWSKLIESAAAIGYDPNNMHMACYDWRLSYRALERRDRYFTRLRASIETLVKTSGQKAVIVGHSMGANVVYYFLQWVTRMAGPAWVASHVHAFVPLGGAMLGAIGPVGALLTGEMQSTAILGPLNKVIDSQMFLLNYTQIRDFLRTWASLGSLLPMGGDAVWGTPDAPTDVEVNFVCHEGHNHTIEGIMKELEEDMGNNSALSDFFHGVKVPQPWPEKASAKAAAGASSNPLATALPPAPDMRIYCLYGIGVETERAYRYANVSAEEAKLPRHQRRFGMIDYRHHTELDDSAGAETEQRPSRPGYASGVASTDGDGTVPLVSQGYPCLGSWREESLKAFNPSRSPTHVREYVNEKTPLWEDPRGGPHAATHVEILGNKEVITDILHILAGDDGHLREDRIHSQIRGITKRVNRNLRKKLGAAAAGKQ